MHLLGSPCNYLHPAEGVAQLFEGQGAQNIWLWELMWGRILWWHTQLWWPAGPSGPGFWTGCTCMVHAVCEVIDACNHDSIT